MLADLLPPVVATAEAFDDDTAVELFPEESAVIARSVDKRRREFTTVRGCARQALGRLGLPPVPIVPGERGAPAWPVDVVGSMTHCDGYRGCAVAQRRDVLTLGLDAEPDAPLPQGVLGAIALPAELDMVRRLTATDSSVSWDRLLFSAKESVYKAWFPLTGAWLDFSQAQIDIDPGDRTFRAELLVPGPDTARGRLTGFSGRWLNRHGLVLTAIVVDAHPAVSTPAGSGSW